MTITKYAFWNNKGGTGKTSLAFQSICRFAETHPDDKILAIDLCPQANLSELLLGGLMGQGSQNLSQLHALNPRKSVGGYFEQRLPSPFSVPNISYSDFICNPSTYNDILPKNIDLLAGDQIVELQSNAIATLANAQIPGIDTFIKVIDWITDFINLTDNRYNYIFIDSNPSFSLYTQIALASVDRLIIPVMADDSSRRAVLNCFSLIHGISVPSSSTYTPFSFPTKLKSAGRALPKVHLIVKNRLTQYMGPASAFVSVLKTIDNDIIATLASDPSAFTFSSLSTGTTNVKDFGTTGVVAFAEGAPFSRLNIGIHTIMGREIQIRRDYLKDCQDAIDGLINNI